MNILIVGGMYPPMRTGTAYYTRNVARALSAKGHRIVVVTLKSVAPVDDEADGFVVHRLPALRLPIAGWFKHFQSCALFLKNWTGLARIARDCDADVILLVNHYLDIAFPAAFAARRRKIPLICSVGTQLQSLNPRRDRVLNLLDRLICGRLVFPYCSRVVAWDTQIRKYLADVHGASVTDKTTIINYGVNGEIGDFLAHQHGYELKGIILGVGAVSEQRSFVPLVRAFAELVPEFPHLQLRIIGHVYYDEAVRLAAALGVAARIHFLGELPHDGVLAEMRAADLMYSSLTAKYVGLGTATIEAMLLGLPTVVNTPLDLLGTVMLTDGVQLIHSPLTLPGDIARQIRRLLTDASLRRRVGEQGRLFVQRHLNWERVAEHLEQTLARELGRSS